MLRCVLLRAIIVSAHLKHGWSLLGSSEAETADQVIALLQPSVSFSIGDDPVEYVHGDWMEVARKASGLQRVECSATLMDVILKLVNEAEGGDAQAMAGLGAIYLFGQDCLQQRNLTWGFHWLSRAAHLEHPDALAAMGFLHASDALSDLYNFTAFTANRSHAQVLFERAAVGGSLYALMALGFRHANGVGVRESCAVSAELYERVSFTRYHDHFRSQARQVLHSHWV